MFISYGVVFDPHHQPQYPHLTCTRFRQPNFTLPSRGYAPTFHWKLRLWNHQQYPHQITKTDAYYLFGQVLYQRMNHD